MSHSRRARPTLRMLRSDLPSGWLSPMVQRSIAENKFDDLHPLSELPHPLITKASECINNDEASDSSQGLIKSSSQIPLLEIKIQQWRGAVWKDPATGVHWVIKAGLAKGGHKDSDDFYKQVGRAAEANSLADWLPGDDDFRLLKQESAARLVTEWELQIQHKVCAALRQVERGGQTLVIISHPAKKSTPLARVVIDVAEVRDEGYDADEILVEILTREEFLATSLEWQMITRALVSLHPPVQAWDRYRDQFSTIADPGAWSARGDELSALNSRGELAEAEPGTHKHYSHRAHIAGSIVNGTSVRALCGVFFVSYQDHEPMPFCPDCQARWNSLPEADS